MWRRRWNCQKYLNPLVLQGRGSNNPNTGPQRDHSSFATNRITGAFAYIDAGYPRRPGDKWVSFRVRTGFARGFASTRKLCAHRTKRIARKVARGQNPCSDSERYCGPGMSFCYHVKLWKRACLGIRLYESKLPLCLNECRDSSKRPKVLFLGDWTLP